jgi:hypothetical protein
MATLGLDYTLFLISGDKNAERIGEPVIDSRAHHNASPEFRAEEKVHRIFAHRAEPIPRYGSIIWLDNAAQI